MSTLRTLGAPALLVAALVATAPAQSSFQERAAAVGLAHSATTGFDRVGWLPSMLDWVQTGAGLGDLDGDGDVDLVACGRFEGTSLFLNQGGSFTDATAGSGLESSGLDNCVALGDYDGDGDLDLFLGSMGPFEGPIASHDRLLRNDGTGQFTEVPGAIDTRGGGHTIHAMFFDLDHDGDLDLHLSQFNGTPNQLHINNGDGTFTERASQLGADVGGSTHAVGIADFDGDGYVDILVGNDWMVTAAAGMQSNENDKHLAGVGDGTFVDVTAGSGIEIFGTFYATTMGLAVGDVNYDGLPDVFRSEYGPQNLAINHGWPSGGPWTQEQVAYGVDSPLVPHDVIPGNFGPAVGWGVRFLHADHDLWLDLYEVTGHISIGDPRDQRNFLFRGDGPASQFHFSDATAAMGLYEERDDRGLCVGDPDADGDLDLIVLPAAGDLRYHENDASTSSDGWLEVVVQTNTSAPGGAGTRVEFTDSAGYPHVTWIGADGATASHNELLAHFGLGEEPAVDLTVTFQSGLAVQLFGVLPNQRLTVVEPELVRLSKTKLPSAQIGGVAQLHVRAYAHDSSGSPLDGTATVTIDVPGLAPSGPVVHVGGNEFRRSFQPAATPGSHRVAVSFDGWSPRVRPTVNYIGEVSATLSTLRLFPDCVRAGSSDTIEVVVTPRDEKGIPIGKGFLVGAYLPGPGGIPPTKLTDQGDGTYRATLPAPAKAGLHRLLLGIKTPSGFTQFQAPSLFEAASVATSADHYEEVPNPTFASSPGQLKLTLTPRDSAGLRLGPGAAIDLQLVPTVGSTGVIELPALRRVTPDGTFHFVLERLSGTPPYSGAGDLLVSVDGNQTLSVPYQF
ncbi:MAG: FG-GAP-like repeat-containing protein [Planctomycetota bacterium]|nr:FG-GAP-like repeat-containing protein [Planctomycetota bacterium]